MIWIEKLKIKNFKSIEDEEIEFDKGLNILVGPNNAGKTNIIEAIDLILGDVYLPNFEPTTDHFFNGDENREIIIGAYLKCDKNEIRNIFPGNNSHQVAIRFRYSKNNKGIFEICNGTNTQWECKTSYGKPSPYGYYYDLDKKLFFLRVKSLRNIMEIAPIRWKSPLKYFKEIIIKRASENELNEVISKIEEAKNKLTEIEEVKKIIEALLKISKEQTDIKDILISPASTKYSDILNEMKILIDDGYQSDVIKKGLGTQNLIIISLFRVMAKYIREEEQKFVIYGIDEPEIGLHPHSQRQLLNSLNKLSEYSQVIITTHSDNLVDISDIDKVIRISREGNRSKKYKISLKPKEKKILEIHGPYLKEIFFAKRVLIVEGATERGFFPEASKKVIGKAKNGEEINYSFDYNSVSVIDGNGNNIFLFMRLVKALRIPFIVLIDEDKIKNGNYISFLEKIKEINFIDEAQFEKLKSIANFDKQKEKLKELNIYILPAFETTIRDSLNNSALKKVKQAIDFAKQNWGYELKEYTPPNPSDLKDLVFNYLKDNKRWRIGKAIAQELNKDEIPEYYVDLIKKVSKL